MTRILIADDHEVVRSGLRSILEAHPGWDVVAEAADGKEAIKKALETKPDVAVIDYSLPLLSGIEATRQIRKREPGTEVLIFTMHEEEILVRSVLEAGALGYLLKADAKKYLVARWRRWLNISLFSPRGSRKPCSRRFWENLALPPITRFPRARNP
jgi:DNA-binding NarL/FixJ family response regulator